MSRLGAYAIIGELGRGGAGVVFRGRGPDGSDVAIKVLNPGSTADALARFERERRLLAGLGEAAGFVPLLDAGTGASGPFLVMPYLSGGTLRDRLQRGPLGADEAVEIVATIGLAVGRAHALGIVHRDLKPENILFAADGRPLVADLGLAKHFLGDTPGASQSVMLSRTGELRGTVSYMAPEQAVSATSAGPPADVFALGAILHECLAGEPAFAGLTPLDVLDRIQDGRRSHLPAEAGVPPWLAAVLERALAPAPARRYADATALAGALASKEPPTTWRRTLVAAGSFVAASVVVACAWRLAAAEAGAAPPRAPRTDPALDPAPAPDPRPSPAPATAPALADEAERARAAGRFEEAAALATRALELDPSRAAAWVIRGRARAARGDHAGALADLDRAHAWAPDDPIVLGNRAALRGWKGDFRGAVDDASRALELDPRLPGALNVRGRARIELGDLDGANADLDRALALDPRIAEAWANRAVVRGRKGDGAGALADNERAVELDPNLAEAWNGIGRWRGELGDRAGALAALTRALDLDPRLASAWGNRGVTKLDLADAEGALADLTRAVELDPRDAYSWASLGEAHTQLGELAKAAADLERFLELAPRDPNAAAVQGALTDLRRRLAAGEGRR